MTQELIIAIPLGICLSAAVGLKIFLPFLITSLFMKFGLFEVSETFQFLGSWTAIILLSIATITEILSYYIPYVDSFLDSIATPGATIAGAIIAMLVLPGDLGITAMWAIGIIGGGSTALATQSITNFARPIEKPILPTGGAVATTEVIGAASIPAIVLASPILSIIAAIIIVISLIFLIILLLFLKRLFKNIFSFFFNIFTKSNKPQGELS